MAHHVLKLSLLSSMFVSATAFAAPKPFDLDLFKSLTNDPAYPMPSDEEVALHSIESCAPPLRLCQEKPLDLDGQAGVDMIVGVNQPTFKRFYSGRNNGLFNPPVYFGQRVASTSGLKIADLDGDGDLDMVETVRGNGTTGTNTVYVNRNSSLQSLFDGQQALDSSKHDRSSSVAIGDVNNDGKLDVVVTNETPGAQDNPGGASLPYGQTNYVYLNQTTTPNTVVFGPALALDVPAAVAYTRRGLLIDVEGDGDLDLVVTAASNHLDPSGLGNWLYVNGTVGGSPAPAPGTNPFAAAIKLNADPADDTDVANSIAAGDIDGDGDPDLVFSTWSRMNGASAGAASNRYYINNSTSGAIDFETTGTFGPGAHHTNVRLADFNNDGRLDALFTVLDGGPNRLHLNSGVAPFFDAGIELAENGYAVENSRGLDVADLNNDDAPDVIVVNRNQIGLRYLNNDQCTAGNCGSFEGPFDNSVASITSQTSALVPPGVAPIDLNTLLPAFAVTDRDNVYPSDFTAVVSAPGAGSEYTCTDGLVPSGPTSGTCANGKITPIPGADANGTIGPIDFKVRDGEDNSAGFSAQLTVGSGSVPTFTMTPLPDAVEDRESPLYATTITATDAEGEYPLVFESVGFLPTWLELVAGPQNTVELKAKTPPRQGDVGEHTITLVARDSTGLQSLPAVFTLEVANVNDKPTVITTTLPKGTQGVAYSATVSGADEDGTTPTFTPTTGLPAGLTIAANGAISGTPTVSGTFPVDLIATDGLLMSDPVRADLLIEAAAGTNAAPVLTAPGPQTATVGQAFELTVTATDADNDPLTFTATGLPAGLTMSAAGAISGTATDTAGSPHTVTVNVADGKGGTDSETFELTVQPAGNRAPTFTAPGPQSGTVGTAFTLSLSGSAADADGDPVTFAATGLPPGITLSSAGLLSGSPTTATGSPFTVNVTVSDGKGGQGSGSFQFTVSNPTSNSGGGSSGGGGSLGLLEVLALLGLATLAMKRRRIAVLATRG